MDLALLAFNIKDLILRLWRIGTSDLEKDEVTISIEVTGVKNLHKLNTTGNNNVVRTSSD